VVSRPSQLARLLGDRIEALRKERALTQEKLAWDADLNSKGYLSRIEAGQRLPSLGVLLNLAKCLDVEVRDLFIFPTQGPVDQAMESIRRGGAIVTEGEPSGMGSKSRKG
jgi:transcriptional regulator with XRE-family HTH domain